MNAALFTDGFEIDFVYTAAWVSSTRSDLVFVIIPSLEGSKLFNGMTGRLFVKDKSFDVQLDSLSYYTEGELKCRFVKCAPIGEEYDLE